MSGSVESFPSFAPPIPSTLNDQARSDHYYCVVAFPAGYALTSDVIIRDASGRSYLLSSDELELTPLNPDELNSLGMFFEPSQHSSWHTAVELRRMIFGISSGDSSVG